MRLTFLVSLAAMTLLFVTLWKYELASKHAREQLRSLRRPLAATRRRGERVASACRCRLLPPRCRSTRRASTSPAPTSSSSR